MPDLRQLAVVYKLVCRNCECKNSVTKIAHFMSRKLKITVTTEFIWFALDQLKRDGMLDKSEQFETEFGSLNQRAECVDGAECLVLKNNLSQFFDGRCFNK